MGDVLASVVRCVGSNNTLLLPTLFLPQRRAFCRRYAVEQRGWMQPISLVEYSSTFICVHFCCTTPPPHIVEFENIEASIGRPIFCSSILIKKAAQLKIAQFETLH